MFLLSPALCHELSTHIVLVPGLIASTRPVPTPVEVWKNPPVVPAGSSVPLSIDQPAFRRSRRASSASTAASRPGQSARVT
jgi:hypothetical protein